MNIQINIECRPNIHNFEALKELGNSRESLIVVEAARKLKEELKAEFSNWSSEFWNQMTVVVLDEEIDRIIQHLLDETFGTKTTVKNMNVPWQILNLPIRAKSAISAQGDSPKTVRDLMNITDEEFLKGKNVGPVAIKQIRSAIEKFLTE